MAGPQGTELTGFGFVDPLLSKGKIVLEPQVFDTESGVFRHVVQQGLFEQSVLTLAGAGNLKAELYNKDLSDFGTIRNPTISGVWDSRTRKGYESRSVRVSEGVQPAVLSFDLCITPQRLDVSFGLFGPDGPSLDLPKTANELLREFCNVFWGQDTETGGSSDAAEFLQAVEQELNAPVANLDEFTQISVGTKQRVWRLGEGTDPDILVPLPPQTEPLFRFRSFRLQSPAGSDKLDLSVTMDQYLNPPILAIIR